MGGWVGAEGGGNIIVFNNTLGITHTFTIKHNTESNNQ